MTSGGKKLFNWVEISHSLYTEMDWWFIGKHELIVTRSHKIKFGCGNNLSFIIDEQSKLIFNELSPFLGGKYGRPFELLKVISLIVFCGSPFELLTQITSQNLAAKFFSVNTWYGIKIINKKHDN